MYIIIIYYYYLLIVPKLGFRVDLLAPRSVASSKRAIPKGKLAVMICGHHLSDVSVGEWMTNSSVS